MVIAFYSPSSHAFLVVAVDEADLGGAARAVSKLTGCRKLVWNKHGLFGGLNDFFFFWDYRIQLDRRLLDDSARIDLWDPDDVLWRRTAGYAVFRV